MKMDYIPLLCIQRELQGLPRNYARFQQYLRTMLGRDCVELPPLGIMNPMGREHVTALLDALLELDADGIGARAAAEASAALREISGECKIALVVADDLMGGWTNRHDYEFQLRFGAGLGSLERDPDAPSGFRLPRWLKDLWLIGVLWSSEPASARAVREAILLPAYRFAYVDRHGPARTLRERLVQEGHVMAAAGCAGPVLEDDDIDYTREVLAPFLDAEDKRTCIECLFGDAAARTLGFTPRGLSPWAGLALALHEARQDNHASGCGRIALNGAPPEPGRGA
ncbi:MAG TPA: hypothetical protein VFD71_03050 [Planctomycetota bacterium]|nr:hypothetical protein [Planctomycetota bacterium]